MQVAETRAVQCNHAHRAGLLGAAEEAVAALEQFGQIQLQAAAHGADHVWFEFGVEKVLKIRQAVLGRHLEKQFRVFALPGKIRRDVIGGNGKGEDSALGVARSHHLDVGAVDHVHFGLQIAVGEFHGLAADDGNLIAQILGAGPVEGQIREGCLRSPPRRYVEVIDQLLNALPHLLVG